MSLLAAWLFGPLSVLAATPTSLTMDTDSSITVGVHPTVTVRLTGPAGPVARAAVQVQLDGRQTMRVVTDGRGEATTVLARDLEAGDYEIQALFRGTADLVASVSAAATLHVTPASFTVRTVPPMAGLPLIRVDGGRTLWTAADGTVRISIPEVRRYDLEVILPPAEPDRQLTFDRWGDGSREPKRTIRLPGRVELALGLEVSHAVAFSFIDSTGAGVDPARIETMLIANDRGNILDPRDRATEWLTANRIMRGADGLTSVPIEYRIQEVGVRGSNVVDRGRLHFRPDGQMTTWVIPLLLYSLMFSGQDALFGSPLGSSVQLAYPDGTIESVRLDERASATISALPRGNYQALIEDPPGFAVSTPVVLSRDQFVRVPVISYLDVVVVVGGGLTLAAVLVLFGGRPVGRIGRRAIGRLPDGGLMVLRATSAAAHVRGRTLSRMTSGRQPEPPAPSLTMPGGSAGALAVPLEVAAAAALQPRINDLAAPNSPRHGGRRRYCPECGHRLTSRGRRCRACGWHRS